MGELTFFLGLQVKQKEDGDFISQDKYVTEILKKFGFSDVKTASTPMETHKPLLKDADGEDVDKHLYRSMIESLMYLTSLRPDIMFVVCACARFQVNPKISHLHAARRIFRYLKGQPKLGLWYPKDSPFDLVAFIDSDYAGASLDRKSTTGGCQFLGYRLISWQCKKQTVVANSITEAEYIAAYNCYGQTKHIEIRNHFIRDSNEKKLIQMIKIYTDQNVTDLLTKAFDISRFQYLIATARDEIEVKTGNSRVNAAGHYLVLLGEKNVDFDEIVDFLNANPIRPSKAKRATEISQSSGPISLVADETVTKETEDRIERVATTASSLEVEQDNGNINKTQSMATLTKPSPQGTSSGSGPSPMTHLSQELTHMEAGRTRLKLKGFDGALTKLSDFGLLIGEQQRHLKQRRISKLRRGVKNLERKRKSKTLGMNLFKIGTSTRRSLGEEDASKQERKIADIDADEEVTLIDETQGRNDDNLMFDTGVLDEQEVEVEKVVSTAEVTTASATTTTVDELTLAQTLIEIKAAKPKAVTTAATTTTTAVTRPKARGVVVQEPSEFTTTTSPSQPSQLPQAKDKGKAKMVEPEKPLKKKDQILIDEEIAQRLQEELQAELEEEERLARQKEEDVNNAEWDNIQAMIDEDYKLAARLQAQEQEEFTIEERSKMFVELMDKKRSILQDLEQKSREENHQLKRRREKLFDKAMTRVNMFVDMDTELVKESSKKAEMEQESSSKRAGEELESDNSKKQKFDKSVEVKLDDKAEMKKHMEIVSDDENIDREDLKTLWKLVKAKHGNTRPEEAYETVLWGDLKVMFEPDVESNVWRNQQGYKVTLQVKDATIEKLKANIKRLNKTSTTNIVKKYIDEIETINIELEHKVAKLIAKKEHLQKTYKQLYDSIKPSRVHAK
ncbi:hypothetical protein Tco_1153850 [Tanacetum coccineum]